MVFKIYMLTYEGRFKTKEEAEAQKLRYEKVYGNTKKLKFEVREE